MLKPGSLQLRCPRIQSGRSKPSWSCGFGQSGYQNGRRAMSVQNYNAFYRDPDRQVMLLLLRAALSLPLFAVWISAFSFIPDRSGQTFLRSLLGPLAYGLTGSLVSRIPQDLVSDRARLTPSRSRCSCATVCLYCIECIITLSTNRSTDQTGTKSVFQCWHLAMFSR